MIDINNWIIRGRNNNYKYMLVVFDLEDKSYYPVYFATEKESQIFCSNIISESKCKVIQSHEL